MEILLAFLRGQVPHVAESLHEFFPLARIEIAPLAEDVSRFPALSWREPGKDRLPFAKLFLPFRRQLIPAAQVFPNPFLARGREALEALVVGEHPFLLLGRQIAQPPEESRTLGAQSRTLPCCTDPPTLQEGQLEARDALRIGWKRRQQEGSQKNHAESNPAYPGPSKSPGSMRVLGRAIHHIHPQEN